MKHVKVLDQDRVMCFLRPWLIGKSSSMSINGHFSMGNHPHNSIHGSLQTSHEMRLHGFPWANVNH